MRQALNATDFLKRAEKVIPYPIEIISGNEEARLIFMGVEHTQPEKGRKLVIDIGGGSTELVIGEDFEPKLVESRRMGCVSFAQMYFPGGAISRENFQRARMAAAQKLETLTWQFRIQGWNVALGASGTIKAAHEVLLEMGEKDGFITPERLDKLRSEVLKHASFDALSLPGLSEERKAVFVPDSRFCAAFLTHWLSANSAFLMAHYAKACCMRWKVVFATRRSQPYREQPGEPVQHRQRTGPARTGNDDANVRSVAYAAAKAGQSTTGSVAALGGDAA